MNGIDNFNNDTNNFNNNNNDENNSNIKNNTDSKVNGTLLPPTKKKRYSYWETPRFFTKTKTKP